MVGSPGPQLSELLGSWHAAPAFKRLPWHFADPQVSPSPQAVTNRWLGADKYRGLIAQDLLFKDRPAPRGKGWWRDAPRDWDWHIYTVHTMHRRDRDTLVAQLVKNLSAMQETPVQFLGGEDLLKKG